MNQQIKKLWIDALRSGEYKQGTARLRTTDDTGGDRFCCLGVLCDVHAKTTGEGSWIYQGGWIYRTETEGYERRALETLGGGAIMSIPNPVEQWADFRNDTQLGGPNLDLAAYNDQRNFTFAQIADLIEAEA